MTARSRHPRRALLCLLLGVALSPACRCHQEQVAAAPEAARLPGAESDKAVQAARQALAEGRYPDARRRLARLAEQGLVEAQFELGRLLEGGLGGPTDVAGAAAWYRKAADARLPQAQLALGRLHLAGRGVPQDDAKAYLWLSLAAEAGLSAEAGPELAILEARMSPGQLRKAKKMLNVIRNLARLGR